MAPKIERTKQGQTKFGSKQEGTQAAHILSYEVVNSVMNKKLGPNYGEETQKQINREMNKDQNLRIKTKQGNLYGNDGYHGDRYHDTQIVEAIDSNDAKNKYINNQQTVERIKKQYEQVQQSNLPDTLKQEVRHQFTQLRDQDGHVIIRKNAALE